jgi:hypothetical protein
MTYTIEWSGSAAEVTTAAEVDAVLDRIAADPRAYLVHVIPPGNTSVLELVWGHPERAMIMYADDRQGGWGIEPSLPPLAEDLNYDHGSVEPERTGSPPPLSGRRWWQNCYASASPAAGTPGAAHRDPAGHRVGGTPVRAAAGAQSPQQ